MPRTARTVFSSLPNHPRKVFLIFWACTALLYLPAWRAGFGADFHGWLQMYYRQSFGAAINRSSASIHSLYQLTQLQLYGLTALFGTHPLPWFLLLTGLHALAAAMLGSLCKKVFEDFGLSNAGWIAITGAVLFLIHPSNTEVVVWKACYHYPVGLIIVLGIMMLLRRYLISGEARLAWLAAVIFVAASFTLEIFYAIPWMCLLLCIAYRMARIISPKRSLRGITIFFLPQLLLFGFHLLLYHVVYGKWMAHGAYENPDKSGWKVLAARIWSYEFHGLLLGRMWPDKVRSAVYHSLSGTPAAAWVITALIALLFMMALLRYKSWSPRLRISALLAGWALLALGLVLHMTIPDLFIVWNDRYLYFTIAFQCMIIAVIIGALLPRYKTGMVIAAIIMMTIFFSATEYTVLQWRRSARIFWALQQKFRWKDAPVVLLLNLPTYYNGVFIYSAEVPESLNEHLKIFERDSMRGKGYDVAGYNMQGPGDGAHVTVLDSLHLKVTLNQWGSWWWRRTLGASDYENEQYSVRFTDPGHEYLLTLKQTVPGEIILYQQGDEWRVADLKKVGVAQR